MYGQQFKSQGNNYFTASGYVCLLSLNNKQETLKNGSHDYKWRLL